LGVRKSEKSLKYLGLPSPPSGDLPTAGRFRGLWGCEKITPFNICSGYSLQSFLFVPHKKGFPLLSRTCPDILVGSPSAENLYSAFTKAEIEAEIDSKIEAYKNVAHFAIFASLRETKNVAHFAIFASLRETKNVAHFAIFASLRETKNKNLNTIIKEHKPLFLQP
jgi:hypothetical protein